MKNPMDRQLEKRHSDRAVAIGREGDVAAFGELLTLLESSSANARRLAASALGKLAWMGVDQAAAVAALAPVARSDPHAQTRQYAIKGLKAYGAAARSCLHDLRDMAANPAEKEYIRRDAAAAVEFIEESLRIADAVVEHRCQRCGARITADEFARSCQAFQRVFCDRCFDEVFLARRNFETQVELNKTIEARDGTVVQSEGERRIAEWMTAHGIAYRYDAKFRIIGEFQMRPDFYLPELDVYVEYWGLDTPQYKMSMYKKQTLYQQEGKRLISVYPKDLPRLDALLSAKLRLFGHAVGADERSEVSSFRLLVNIRYFAMLREQAGTGEETIRTTAATPRALWAELSARHGFAAPLSALRVAVNEEFVTPEHALREGDTVAFIPPVAGG
jgi:molybdopterin converting factor subunit 1